MRINHLKNHLFFNREKNFQNKLSHFFLKMMFSGVFNVSFRKIFHFYVIHYHFLLKIKLLQKIYFYSLSIISKKKNKYFSSFLILLIYRIYEKKIHNKNLMIQANRTNIDLLKKNFLLIKIEYQIFQKTSKSNQLNFTFSYINKFDVILFKDSSRTQILQITFIYAHFILSLFKGNKLITYSEPRTIKNELNDEKLEFLDSNFHQRKLKAITSEKRDGKINFQLFFNFYYNRYLSPIFINITLNNNCVEIYFKNRNRSSFLYGIKFPIIYPFPFKNYLPLKRIKY